MHVIASAEVLRETPLPHAVASYPLKEAAAAIRSGGVSLPHGAGRFVVSVDGTESKEDITALKVSRSCCSARQHSVAAAFAYKQVMCRLHGNEASLRRFPQSSLHAVCVQLTSANSEDFPAHHAHGKDPVSCTCPKSAESQGCLAVTVLLRFEAQQQRYAKTMCLSRVCALLCRDLKQ